MELNESLIEDDINNIPRGETELFLFRNYETDTKCIEPRSEDRIFP